MGMGHWGKGTGEPHGLQWVSSGGDRVILQLMDSVRCSRTDAYQLKVNSRPLDMFCEGWKRSALESG